MEFFNVAGLKITAKHLTVCHLLRIGDELIAVVVVFMSLLFAISSLYDSYNSIFDKKVKYTDIGIGFLFLAGIRRFYKVYNRKKRGKDEITKLMLKLKTFDSK